MGRKIGRGLVARSLGGSTRLGVSSCPPTSSVFFLVDGINMAGRKASLASRGEKKIGGKIHLEEPTLLIDQVRLGCTKRESVTKESNVKTKECLLCYDTEARSKIKVIHRKVVSWRYNMKVHADNCVERHCELAHKTRGAGIRSFNTLQG